MPAAHGRGRIRGQDAGHLHALRRARQPHPAPGRGDRPGGRGRRGGVRGALPRAASSRHWFVPKGNRSCALAAGRPGRASAAPSMHTPQHVGSSGPAAAQGLLVLRVEWQLRSPSRSSAAASTGGGRTPRHALRYVPLAEFDLWQHLMETRHGRQVSVECDLGLDRRGSGALELGLRGRRPGARAARAPRACRDRRGLRVPVERFFPAETYPLAQEALLSHFEGTQCPSGSWPRPATSCPSGAGAGSPRSLAAGRLSPGSAEPARRPSARDAAWR